MKLRFGIREKIFAGFFVLITVFTINAIISVITLNKNIKVVDDISSNIDPSLAAIKDFNLMVVKSRMLAANWVYLQNNELDKISLKELHAKDYPEISGKLKSLTKNWTNKNEMLMMDTVSMTFATLLKAQTQIMELLLKFEDYEDPAKQFEAEDIIESQVIPMSNDVINKLDIITKSKVKEKGEYQQLLSDSSHRLRSTVIWLSIILIFIGIVISIYVAQSITRPVKMIQHTINKLSVGELTEITAKETRDEIGEMVKSVKKLIAGLKSTSAFSDNIGSGKLDEHFEPLSEKDVLGNSLLTMRANLKRVAIDDERRNWANEGFAKFAEILRNDNDNIEKLSGNILTNIIKYTNSNQGSLFILNSENENDQFLELIACNAWGRKKFLEKRVDIGEGLVGQAWQEQEKIFLTDVPQNYVSITSGLGEANPRCILIMPLKLNDIIFGVIELASFKVFETYQIDFIQKIAESIASTISTAKINDRTKKLLEISQQQSEEMKAQEEEMRQNMEELQATQEEMERKNKEIEQQASFQKLETQKIVAQYQKVEEELKAKIFEMEKAKR